MPFQRTQTADDLLNRIQDQIARTIASIEASPFISGNAISQDLVSGQDNLVAHKLGRAIRYWIPLRKNANADVWEQSTSQLGNVSSNDSYLNLRCSANCTVTLWVS
jgi:hypothetical protein